MRMPGELRRDVREIYEAALRAANASSAVGRHLTRSGDELIAGTRRYAIGSGRRVVLVAVGKAAPQMARAVEAVVGESLAEALIVTKYGYATGYGSGWSAGVESTGSSPGSRRYAAMEAGHPVPDEESVRAGSAVVALLERLKSEDLLIVAVSGGASALLCAPVEGISLAAKQQTTDLLLRTGADIQALNCVRKHLSLLKGGNLAARANGAEVLGLILSDVVGDSLDVIGSGLTAPDRSTFKQAVEVLRRSDAFSDFPEEVRRHLERGAAGDVPETPKPGDRAFERTHNSIVGSGRLALAAAAAEAKRLGYRAKVISSTIQGEARDEARRYAANILEAEHSAAGLPVCLLLGGETTVNLSGDGKGGRNQEFALAAAIAIENERNIVCLACGTDGTDGPTDAAGAIVDGATVRRGRELGLEAAEYLVRNDSYHFFDRLGDLVKTGPTGTNVMDVTIMLAG